MWPVNNSIHEKNKNISLCFIATLDFLFIWSLNWKIFSTIFFTLRFYILQQSSLCSSFRIVISPFRSVRLYVQILLITERIWLCFSVHITNALFQHVFLEVGLSQEKNYKQNYWGLFPPLFRESTQRLGAKPLINT